MSKVIEVKEMERVEADWKSTAALAYGILRTKMIDKKLVTQEDLKDLQGIFNPRLIVKEINEN